MLLLWLRHFDWILKYLALWFRQWVINMAICRIRLIFFSCFSPGYYLERTWETWDCVSSDCQCVVLPCCAAYNDLTVHQPLPCQDSSMLSRSPATLCLSVTRPEQLKYQSLTFFILASQLPDWPLCSHYLVVESWKWCSIIISHSSGPKLAGCVIWRWNLSPGQFSQSVCLARPCVLVCRPGSTSHHSSPSLTVSLSGCDSFLYSCCKPPTIGTSRKEKDLIEKR